MSKKTGVMNTTLIIEITNHKTKKYEKRIVIDVKHYFDAYDV